MASPFLIITHDLTVARYVSDKVVVLYRGRVVEGPAKDVVARPLHPYTRALLQAAEDFTAPPRLESTGMAGGCPYRGDCTRQVSRCHAEKPDLRVIAPDRNAACHRAEEA